MGTFKFAAALLLAAWPCAAATQDVVLVPDGKTVEARATDHSGWVPVTEPVRVKDGAQIRTGADSKAAVVLKDGSRFQLSGDSFFAVEDTSRKTSAFKLMFGKVRAAVAGYFSSRFEVRTPAAVCAVRGTEFEVDVARDGNTEMNVSEGLVEVNDNMGRMAVVSSEERVRIGMESGMSAPETVALTDKAAEPAARPYAVRAETARERTRTMLEELRNRELKANEAQLGKDAIDAFGKRVRLEEYLLRPSDSEFKLLFLSKRPDQDTLDWGHLVEQFNSKIPDDISQVGDIISGMYFSKTAPANWMKYFEVYLTNTVDSVKETIDFGAPVAIDLRGYTGSSTADYRYYPGTIDYRQILSGPGVALALGAGSTLNTGLSSLNSDERVQFRQTQDWNSTTSNQFTWTLNVVDNSGKLNTLQQVTLDPTSAADIANGYTTVPVYEIGNTAIDTVDPFDPSTGGDPAGHYPSGPNMADYMEKTIYADGSSVYTRKMLVSNEGNILGIGGDATASTFLKEGSYNLEMVVGSSLFEGRSIDVLLAPEILTQKKEAATTADSFSVN
ncbi:MAG: FecR family protein [Elusimicrobia bacterium]|nr:FecR family protein [Elusimicrobiota bacterium]